MAHLDGDRFLLMLCSSRLYSKDGYLYMVTKLSRHNGNFHESRSHWEVRDHDGSRRHPLANFAQLILEGAWPLDLNFQKDLGSQSEHYPYDSITGIPPAGLRLCLIYAYSG